MSKEEEAGTVETVAVTATTAGDMSPVAGNKGTIAGSVPKCVCSWKNCRVYQKFFRDHPVWDGVIRLKFTNTEPETMALKASIDRNLKVHHAKAEEWKPTKGTTEKVCKYNVACHHWTEQHIQKYRSDPKRYSFTQPFSFHGAKKYLHKVDPKETFKDPTGGKDADVLYLQSPLVPKEDVKDLFYRLKEIADKGGAAGGNDKELRRAGSRRKILKDDDEDDNLYQEVRHQAPQMPQQGTSVSASAGRNGAGSNPRQLEAKDKKGSMRGLTHEERKDSLTVSTNLSNKTSDVLLQEKDVEIKRLRTEINEMQSTLGYLHDMVSKLQEELYDQHAAKNGPRAPAHKLGPNSGHSGRRRITEGADGSSRRTGSRSSRTSVPNEIEIDESEDDGNWVEEAIDEEWSVEDDDEDERSRGTFHVNYGLKRNASFSSKASTRSRATSIVSNAKSLKSLPREIELDEDDDSHESLEEEAFDNKSFASQKNNRGPARSGSQRSIPNKRRGAPQPQRRQSEGATSRQSGSSKGSSKRDESSLSGVYQVTALIVTDPYGEQGTYTGSISNSTGMPHGFGRLEYDKAGRWYEGDWRHGRWTGQGRLSNGDGDFYEGGLKSDHKHGRGIMKFADGRIFEGDYVNGQMVDGKMTYQDGSTYTGGWVDGMRHGRGRCVFTDRSVYEGEFREGEFFGFGKMSWSDGGWYEGEWYNGEMQGFGKEIRPDGSLRHEGQWAKGQPIRK